MSEAGYARFVLWLICGCAPLCAAGTPGDGAAHPTRQQLLGAWRLVSIDYAGPRGPLPDPFYQAGSTGIIIYESTGWMSVHIAAPHRPGWPIPESRASSGAEAGQARAKAAAFDTYYAYFGTWEYDEATSTVTHHVQSSLIPGESGHNYAQTVTLDGGHLIFTTRREVAGGAAVQKKVWQRITGPNG